MNRQTWSRLLSVAREERKYLLWGLFFLVLSSGNGLIFPQIIRLLIDKVLAPRKIELLLPSVLAIFIAFTIQGLASSLRYYFFTLSGERMVLRLRRRLFAKILNEEVAFFDFNRTGDLISRLSSDCTTLQNTVSVNVSMGLRNWAQVMGGFCFMFYTSWKLSSLMLLFIPPVALSTLFFGRRIRKLSQEFQGTLADSSVIAEETISGVRTVKSFVQESAEVERYGQCLEQSLLKARKKIKTIAAFMTCAMVAGFGAVSFVLWYGGKQAVSGRLSLGDLTQFLLYLMIVAIGSGSLGSLWGDLMAGIGASKRIFEILERVPPEKATGQAVLADKDFYSLELRDVTFNYPSRPDLPVLKGVNLTVGPGQTVAIVGPSGSGKTTLTALISKFYEVTSGQILWDGTDISRLRADWLREKIGIVSQEPVLISTTIGQNIRYGRQDASMQEIMEAATAANVLEFINGFPDGFDTVVGEKGLQLSGGQKQRVAIARAILKAPKFLILDEATSNLDTANESLVQEALQRLMKGRTTLVITHRLSLAKNADKIFVMKDGVIVQQGGHEQLAAVEGGLYHQLLQRQYIEGK